MLEDDRRKFIENVISIYSPSGKESELGLLLWEELEKRNLKPRIDDAGNVVCEYGKAGTSLLLCGHMDTIPGEILVKVENDVVYGRGACDAKGALCSLLFAFEDLVKSSVEGRMIFAAVTGEEQASAGLAELIKNNVKSDFAIFGEPGGESKITLGYRGHFTIDLRVETPEVHASAPKLTTNSAELAFEIYERIKEDLDAVNNNSTDKVSASLTKINSGSAHNVIPGVTIAHVDVRIPVGLSSEPLTEKVNEVKSSFSRIHPEAKISLECSESTPPYRVPVNSPLVRALSRSILRKGAKPTMVVKSGTGDMNTYALAYGIDAVTYGPGDAKLSHTSDEQVSFNEVFSCSSILVSAARELLANKAK